MTEIKVSLHDTGEGAAFNRLIRAGRDATTLPVGWSPRARVYELWNMIASLKFMAWSPRMPVLSGDMTAGVVPIDRRYECDDCGMICDFSRLMGGGPRMIVSEMWPGLRAAHVSGVRRSESDGGR